jgi:hypothetical protein
MVMEIIGWVGSLLIVLMYGLNSYQKIKSDSLIYYLSNIIGGICLIIYSVYKEAHPNTFINVVWVLIALPAIFKVIFGEKK